MLYASSGRFGGFGVPDGYAPEAAHVLFKLEVPFADRGLRMQRKRPTTNSVLDRQLGEYSRTYGRDPDDIEQFRVPSDSSHPDPVPPLYLPSLDDERFECNREAEGFHWWLTRRDLRPHLIARVKESVKREKHEYITLVLHGVGSLVPEPRIVGQEISAHEWRVEPDDAGRTRVHAGEFVNVVLDKDLEVDRVWPVHHFYMPPECPQCSRPQHPMRSRNQDGVC